MFIQPIRRTARIICFHSQTIVQVDKVSSPPTYKDEFDRKHIKLTGLQKLILSAGSSIASLVNPHRHDMIASLGETTGITALQKMLALMRETAEGQRILLDQPRINTKTIDVDMLKKLPDNTLGYAYWKFLHNNRVTPDSRMDVRFIDDPDLAYVMTRYRECHDLVHTILGLDTHMLGEVAVKWVEALSTGLPMCYGAAIFGAIRLRPKQRKAYVTNYLPWALATGRTIKPLLGVYWEKRWEQDINELRKDLRINLMDPNLKKIA